MTWAVLLGCAGMLGLALFGPRLARRLPPATATRLLGTAAAAVAGITLWVLAVLAFTAIAQVPLVAAFGDWSIPILHATDPIPMWLGVLCGLLWVGVAAQALRGFVKRLIALAALRKLDRTMAPGGPLVILESDQPDAFSTPGGRGRVYVTTGMLRALRPDERRALLAHESSHLAHRHAWWLIAADLAAVVNPLLVPAARALAHAVERWADEDAARVVGDRETVARAVARAALHVHSGTATAFLGATSVAAAGTRPAGAGTRTRRAAGTAIAEPEVRPTRPGALSGRVPDRVQAMLLAPPRLQLLPVLALAALIAASVGAGCAIQNHTEAYFDHASTCPGPDCGHRPGLWLHLRQSGPLHPRPTSASPSR